jgi:hypothetical protein
MKDYTRNNTLYKRLLDAAGDDKLPVLDNKTFESMNAEYGKEEMRKNLADYIATERPVFPLREISEDDMRNSFNSLKNFNTNSICSPKEHVEKEINYAGDISDQHKFGFDGTKIDGCGRQRNQTLYAQLMQESGKNYTIENCHWGRCTDSDDSSCHTREWCPFNWYRSSGDINAAAN